MIRQSGAPANHSIQVQLGSLRRRIGQSDMLRSTFIRVATLPMSALAGFLAARAVVAGTGVDGFSVYTTLVALPGLMPFADLGIGGSLVTSVARNRLDGGAAVINEIVAALLWTSMSGLIICAIGVMLYVSSIGPAALGIASSGDSQLGLLVAILMFGIALPLGLASRIVLGLRKNHIVVLCQSAGAVAGSLGVVLAATAGLRLPVLVIVSLAGPTIGSVAMWVYLVRGWPSMCRQAFGQWRPRSRVPPFPRASLVMLVIAVSLPLAYQTDRIVLNHFAHQVHSTALYSVVVQAYNPCFAVLSSAGIVLWPVLSSGGSDMFTTQKLRQLQRQTLLLGALGSSSLLVGGPVLSRVLLGFWHGSFLVSASFAMLLLVHALLYPLGMSMLTGRGLAFQAFSAASMLVLNLPLSILLAGLIGAAGPPLASAVSVTCCMYLPAEYFCRSRAAGSALC